MTLQQGEDHARLGRKLGQQAIALAVEGRWEEAVAANRAIIERFPNEVAACNRLGRALIELGRFDEATRAYQCALDIDHGNAIATKNMQRLNAWAEVKELGPEKSRGSGKDFFAATIGKTGVVSLTNVTALERMPEAGGGVVFLKRRGQQVFAEDENGLVLGEFEPKHGTRLAKLMQGGNEYSATVLSTGEVGTQLLVREEFQHPSQVGQASFPPTQADKLYGQPARVSPVETPPIVDMGRRSSVSSGRGTDLDSEEPFSDDDDRGAFEGFTMVEEPSDSEGITE
ncbi:MAG: hypothetical protein JW846_04125 [Dehalococcoidia bacterium]|nr:hypothetical protein [Dehalococcoidia bacterium]